ncbi:ribose/xylose/arabinose/galactoside ABC-type transport system permease subunit [Streptomyces canus]|nr:ribose/xylose/arabinose/galactoside ABC-type transport system permease subunit [Streptomyces canus]
MSRHVRVVVFVLLPGAWSIPVTLAVGALVGVLNALLIIRCGLNGFIVTLGELIVLRGVLTGISGGQTFFQVPESMLDRGRAQRADAPGGPEGVHVPGRPCLVRPCLTRSLRRRDRPPRP